MTNDFNEFFAAPAGTGMSFLVQAQIANAIEDKDTSNKSASHSSSNSADYPIIIDPMGDTKMLKSIRTLGDHHFNGSNKSVSGPQIQSNSLLMSLMRRI